MNIYKLLKRPFFGNFMVTWRNPLPEQEKKIGNRFQQRASQVVLFLGYLQQRNLMKPKQQSFWVTQWEKKLKVIF